MSVSLEDRFSGPLTVSIIVGAEVYTEEKDFRECIVGPTTLFDYVGSTAATVFTNLTTRLSIKTCPEEWQVLEFSPEARILKVVKVAGEQWEIQEDNPERLGLIYDLSGEEDGNW